MKFPISLVLVVVALGLGACTTVSERHLEGEVSRQLAFAGGAATRWRRDAAADAAIDALVRQKLAAGVTEDVAVELALLANPDVQLALESLGLARANYLAATVPADPALSWSRRNLRGGPGSNVEVALLQNLTSLWTLPARRRAAQRDLAADKLLVANKLLEIIAATRRAWIAYAAAEQQQVGFARREDLARLSAELAQRYQQAGNLALEEALDEQDHWREIQGEFAEVTLQRDAARVELTRWMGVPELNNAWALSGELPPVPEAELATTDLEAAALQNRLDITAARERLKARLASGRLARQLRFMPELAAGPSREREPSGERVAGIEIDALLPLFSAPELALAASDSAARVALRELEAVLLQARADIRQGQAELATARSLAWQWQESLLPLRESAAEIAQRKFHYMLIGPFEAMAVRAQVHEAAAAAAVARGAYWQAKINLALAAALPIKAVK